MPHETTTPIADSPDPFDLSRLRLSQDFASKIGISYRPLRGRFDEGPSKGPAVS